MCSHVKLIFNGRYIMPWTKEINIPRGCLAQVDFFWGCDYKQETLDLVLALNEVHSFLLAGETAEMFCNYFDYGVVAEHYRALFYKKPIWWKENSCFKSGERVGLPDSLRPYLYLLCFKLSSSKHGNACKIKSGVFDWKSEAPR